MYRDSETILFFISPGRIAQEISQNKNKNKNMQLIHPGQLVISVFGLPQAQEVKKTQTFRIVLSLLAALIIVLTASLLMNSFLLGSEAVGVSFAGNSEKSAYLPSQDVSSRLNSGYLNLR